MSKAKPKTKAKATAKTASKTATKAARKSAPKIKAGQKSAKPAKPAIVTPAEATIKVKPRTVQAPTHNQIAVKAYEIWIAMGQPVGQDAENWEAAKQALLDEA